MDASRGGAKQRRGCNQRASLHLESIDDLGWMNGQRSRVVWLMEEEIKQVVSGADELWGRSEAGVIVGRGRFQAKASDE